MSHDTPELSIRRPVGNITQDHMDNLQSRLIEAAEEFTIPSSDTITERMLQPTHGLYAQIIGRRDFLRIQRRLGDDRLDYDQVQELEGRINEALSGRPDSLDVPTLPTITHYLGEYPKVALRIAHSQDVVSERWLAQNVMADFLGLEKPPRRWLERAKRITPVQLAVSHTREQLALLNWLEGVLESEVRGPEENRPLPSVIKLGEIVTLSSRTSRG